MHMHIQRSDIEKLHAVLMQRGNEFNAKLDLLIEFAEQFASEEITPAENAPEGYLDTWFLFENEDDEETYAEANTRKTENGYAIDWSLTAVGLVTTEEFDTYVEAEAWYTAREYQNYSA